jgi:hypothetical protein
MGTMGTMECIYVVVFHRLSSDVPVPCCVRTFPAFEFPSLPAFAIRSIRSRFCSYRTRAALLVPRSKFLVAFCCDRGFEFSSHSAIVDANLSVSFCNCGSQFRPVLSIVVLCVIFERGKYIWGRVEVYNSQKYKDTGGGNENFLGAGGDRTTLQ